MQHAISNAREGLSRPCARRQTPRAAALGQPAPASAKARRRRSGTSCSTRLPVQCEWVAVPCPEQKHADHRSLSYNLEGPGTGAFAIGHRAVKSVWSKLGHASAAQHAAPGEQTQCDVVYYRVPGSRGANMGTAPPAPGAGSFNSGGGHAQRAAAAALQQRWRRPHEPPPPPPS